MDRSLLIFSLADQRYALPAERVQRVLRAVEVTPLPRAPEAVLGMVNLAGQLVAVIALRRRFGCPERPLRLTDQLILASTAQRTVALLVDETLGLLTPAPADLATAAEIPPGSDLLAGAVKLEDGLVLIHDLDRLLSLAHETALEQAFDKVQAPS